MTIKKRRKHSVCQLGRSVALAWAQEASPTMKKHFSISGDSICVYFYSFLCVLCIVCSKCETVRDIMMGGGVLYDSGLVFDLRISMCPKQPVLQLVSFSSPRFILIGTDCRTLHWCISFMSWNLTVTAYLYMELYLALAFADIRSYKNSGLHVTKLVYMKIKRKNTNYK